MSRTWALTTNTSLQIADIATWLNESKQWSDISINDEFHRLVARSNDSSISLVCCDTGKHRSGTAEGALNKLGLPSTLTFLQELSRAIDHCGRLDEIFRFAFSFAQRDKDCNLYFELEDCGIFKRINGAYTVNPDQFFAKSLAEMLTFKYTLADSDKRTTLVATAEIGTQSKRPNPVQDEQP